MMGFFKQLKLLLWKNFTVKRRHPWVLIAELTIPLVIFFVLVGIRLREEPRRYTIHGAYKQPLPSSGLLAFANKFCPGGERNRVSLFADLIDVLSALHVNNTLLGDVERHSAGEQSSPVESNDLAWIQNDVGDFDLLSSEALWKVNLSLKDALLDDRLESISDFISNKFGVNSDLEQDVFSQNLTLAVLYDMYSNEEEVARIDDEHGSIAGFGALAFHKLFPLLVDLGLSRNDLDQSEVGSMMSSIITSVSFAFTERAKPASERFEPNAIKSTVMCNFMVSSMLTSIKDFDQYKTMVSELFCKDDRQAESDLAMLILSSINSTKAMESAYRNLGREYSQERFDVYSSFTSDLEKIVGVADFLIEKTENDTHEDAMQNDNSRRDANILKFFMNIQPIICGKTDDLTVKSDDYFPTSVDQNVLTRSLKSLNIQHEMIKFSEAGIYILKNNPRILFAPNTSAEVQSIIGNANQSFAMIDAVTRYARDWLEMSRHLRENVFSKRLFKTSYIFSQSVVRKEEMCDQFLFMSSFSCLLRGNSKKDENRKSKPSDPKDDVTSKSSPADGSWLAQRREDAYDLIDDLLSRVDKIDVAAKRWLSFAENVSFDVWMGFESEFHAERWFQKEAYRNKIGVLAIVSFETDNEGKLGKNVKYKIRQNSTLISTPTHEELPNFWTPTMRPDMVEARKYFINGFVLIQDVIERSIIEIISNKTVKEPGLLLSTFPVACNTLDHFLFTVSYVMPLCMTVAWAYSVAMLVQYIVYEKEQGLKEVMRLMGLSNVVHWIAWFITAFIQMQVIAILTALILKLGNVLPHSNIFLIWAFLTLYNIANIMFSFLVSVLYSKAKLAAACAGIIYFLTYVPYLYVSIMEDSHLLGQRVSPRNKYFASLCSTTAFGLGAKYFAVYEVQGTGVQFGNLRYSPFQNDEFNLMDVVKMMILDSVIYALLAWYIEAVFPGQYGLPRPVYFPFTKSYWLPNRRRSSASSLDRLPDKVESLISGIRFTNGDNGQTSVSEENRENIGVKTTKIIEAEPVGLQLGVSIENLTKTYLANGKLAVDHLSLNLYQSQITALLGHNGAGKTTTMSILTGMIPATFGNANIYGKSILDNMDQIRKSLGMCPQHNVLFESLTVEEHLWFYASLKGMSGNDIYYAVNTLLRDIGMELKRVDLVDTLSGGMKRKLSVAIAFIGNAKLVILDEPTAGVDPYARRAIWDLILKFKKGRTILLSTHFMDEADFLADRIAIMSGGRLRCCGSSMFLKCNYGSGYHLTIVKKEKASVAQSHNASHCSTSTAAATRQSSSIISSSDIDSNSINFRASNSSIASASKLVSFVETYIEGAYLDWESNREISLTLPYSQRCNFSRFLDVLQSSLTDLGISSFGLRDTSLEEVFIKAIVDSSRVPTSNKQEKYKQVFNWFYRRTGFTKSGPASCVSTQPKILEINGGGDKGAIAESDVDLSPKVEIRKPLQINSTPQKSIGESQELNLSTMDGAPEGGQQKHGIRKGNSFTNLCAQMTQYPGTDPSEYMLSQTSADGCGVNPLASTSYVRLRQLRALLKKRFLYARRNPKAIFTQIVLPALFVSIAMTVAFYRPMSGSDRPVVLTTANYHRFTGWGKNIIPISIKPHSETRPAPEAEKILNAIILEAGLGSNCLLSNASHSVPDYLLPPRYPSNSTIKDFTPSCWRVRKNHFLLTKGYVPMNLPQTFEIHSPKSRKNLLNFISNALEQYSDTTDYKCKCKYDYTGVECSSKDENLHSEDSVGYVDMAGDKIVFLSKRDERDFFLSIFEESQLNMFGGYSIGNTRNDVDIDFQKSSSQMRSLVKREELYVHYDLKPRQAIPTYINAINNAILRANIEPETHGDPSAYGITLINHPLNNTKLMSLEYFETGTDVVIALFIIIAMSFVPASFVVFLVSERHSNAKHLQMVSGMSPLVFWISNYIWDMLNYTVPAIACILILIWFDLDAYTSKQNLPVVVLLFLLFGWSITPMMYPASFLFQVPSTAYIVLIVGNLFFGVTAIMSVFLLDRFVQEDNLLLNVRSVLENLFLLLPNYNLGRCLAKLAMSDVQNKFNIQIGKSDDIVSAFDWKITGQALTAMSIEGLVFLVLTILIQYRFFVHKSRLPVTTDPIENEDVDVAAERFRILDPEYKVLQGSDSKDEVVFENLSKVYKKRKTNVLAVDRICLGVPQGECFGLLGVNGAGKTSTFKMLTGNTPISAGDASIHNHSVVHALKRVQSVIGYCPQFDALFGELTVNEHLELYSSIRGINHEKQLEVIEWALNTLSLREHQDKQVSTLSGGNKRKLSAAIALLGNPKVVLLDEPTSGMDPIARRFLWDIIKSVVRSGRSVILTSHSMEECEALCSRLAIMVNGHFKCLGSCQHLVNRFGDGYTVNVKVTGFAKQLRNFLRYFYRQYPGAIIIDRHQNQVQYQVASDGLNLAKLFNFLEVCVADSKVEEYSISQTTLERVFINFAREQADEDINILREPLCQHKRTLSGVSDIGSLASEPPEAQEQEFVSLAPTHDFQNNPRSPPPTQVVAPNTFLDDLDLEENIPRVVVNYPYCSSSGVASSTADNSNVSNQSSA